MSAQILDVETQRILTKGDHSHDDKHYYVIVNRNGHGSVARWIATTSNADRSIGSDKLES